MKCKFPISPKKDRILNNKNPIPEDQKAGVYKLVCQEIACKNTIYIGSTQRQFSVRKEEHLRKNSKTAFGKHLQSHKHQLDEEKSRVLSRMTPGDSKLKLELLESF